MNVCKYCSAIGGYHTPFCPAPHAATEYRIEWFGSLQVHQPIRPTVHEAAKDAAVSCA